MGAGSPRLESFCKRCKLATVETQLEAYGISTPQIWQRIPNIVRGLLRLPKLETPDSLHKHSRFPSPGRLP